MLTTFFPRAFSMVAKVSCVDLGTFFTILIQCEIEVLRQYSSVLASVLHQLLDPQLTFADCPARQFHLIFLLN